MVGTYGPDIDEQWACREGRGARPLCRQGGLPVDSIALEREARQVVPIEVLC